MGKYEAILERHIAACGMNCRLCIAYQRDKKPCPGCNEFSEDKPKHCVQCRFIRCVHQQAKSSPLCYDCEKYPCRKNKDLDKRYREKYRMSMIDNLDFIKDEGMEAFLERETTRWTCKKCGAMHTVHRETCLHCDTKTPDFSK